MHSLSTHHPLGMPALVPSQGTSPPQTPASPALTLPRPVPIWWLEGSLLNLHRTSLPCS